MRAAVDGVEHAAVPTLPERVVDRGPRAAVKRRPQDRRCRTAHGNVGAVDSFGGARAGVLESGRERLGNGAAAGQVELEIDHGASAGSDGEEIGLRRRCAEPRHASRQASPW
jgi:hypothetical protein